MKNPFGTKGTETRESIIRRIIDMAPGVFEFRITTDAEATNFYMATVKKTGASARLRIRVSPSASPSAINSKCGFVKARPDKAIAEVENDVEKFVWLFAAEGRYTIATGTDLVRICTFKRDESPGNERRVNFNASEFIPHTPFKGGGFERLLNMAEALELAVATQSMFGR